MKESELLKHAAALREQSKFREAYDAFLSAADKTDNVLGKSAILLDVVINLTTLGEYDASRKQLKVIKEMLSGLDPKHLTQTDQNEFLRVLVGIDVEHAEILAAEGNIEGAIEKLANSGASPFPPTTGPPRTPKSPPTRSNHPPSPPPARCYLIAAIRLRLTA